MEFKILSSTRSHRSSTSPGREPVGSRLAVFGAGFTVLAVALSTMLLLGPGASAQDAAPGALSTAATAEAPSKVVATAAVVQEVCPAPGEVIGDAEGVRAHLRFLSDDALQGREVGTAGERCAGDYLVEEFRQLGLEPGNGGSWFQSFPIRVGSRLGSNNRLRFEEREYPVREAWTPYGFSESRQVDAELVYGHAGIQRPGNPDDPYLQAEVEQKIVVVEDGPPEGVRAGSTYADPHFKASVSRGRGALAMIVLRDDGPLPDPRTEVRPSPGIPVIAVHGPLAQRIREVAMAASEEGAEPVRAVVRAEVEEEMGQGRNVVALLPGSDPKLRNEYLVIGAHYDHLGLGGEGSLAPDDYGSVHNGADDNASGTAALVEVARQLATTDEPPARSVIFLAFSGEEKGLWGSAHYVDEPLYDIGRTVGMLNMDMVGRIQSDQLTVFGTGTAGEWTELLEAANADLADPLDLAYNPDGYGPSDHASFYGAGMPVLHFFSNTHTDYHRPSDDWDRINYEGLERVVELVTGVTKRVVGAGEATRVADLTLIEEEPANPHGELPMGDPDSDESGPTISGYGPYFGSIPDMSPIDFGVRFSGVREDSPADRAGVRSGDVLVEFGGAEISDLYAFTYALREHQVGDTISVVVLRDGERVELTAVLGAR